MAGFNAFLKNNNIITGTAIPTEGNFKTGDIIVNVGPNSATEPMWICNEGGNPGIWGPVGVGSGSIVSINSSVLISEPTNEVSLASLGVGVSSKDKLLVHYNSTHLLEGVHFEISNDGSKIVKLGGGNWNPDGLENCIFALELFKGVESIDGDKIVVDSKMTCKTNHVVIENACSEVEIGIEGFNAGNDMMLVFKNGVNMVEGVDYEVQGGKIVSTGEVWNENGIEDYGMTFVVFKEVVEYNGDAEVKAENIADGSIGMNKLADDVKGAIEEASNIDLSGYATKEEVGGKVAQDAYDAKIAELEGRVNEAFTNANNGKQLIANAIGEPVSAEDTFSAMSNDINSLLSTFKTNMMNNGVMVESSDKFKSLIDKIATMVEEGEGKGIQFASGNIPNITTQVNETKSISLPLNGLTFQPTYLFITIKTITYDFGSSNYDTTSFILDNIITTSTAKTKWIDPNNGRFAIGAYISNITNASCTLTYVTETALSYLGVTGLQDITYYAIGVGEEDTTLRDSLASILQEEGVSVSEEDDMASLISKVDSEFDRQVVPTGDAIAGYVVEGKTFMNSTGQMLTGTMTEHGIYTDYAGYFNANDEKIYLGVKPGAYLLPSGSGYPEVTIPKSIVNNLSPENIVSGKEILGVWGTATLTSMGCPYVVEGDETTFISGKYDGADYMAAEEWTTCSIWEPALLGTYTVSCNYGSSSTGYLNTFDGRICVMRSNGTKEIIVTGSGYAQGGNRTMSCVVTLDGGDYIIFEGISKYEKTYQQYIFSNITIKGTIVKP